MEYKFIFAKSGFGNGSWWLEISDVDQLLDYHKKTENRYDGAMQLFNRLLLNTPSHNPSDVLQTVQQLPPEERIAIVTSKNYQLLTAAILQARQVGGNIFDGFRCLNMEIGATRLDGIHQYGKIFINAVGGHTFGLKPLQFVRRKELVFPHFTAQDIRIKQFDGGAHYYAYIGDLQVRDGDILKWNTREEAYAKARALVQEVL